MKIKYDRKGYMDFSDLFIGDIFEVNGTVYMKTYTIPVDENTAGDDYINSIDLASAKPTYFFSDNLVKKLNAELVINGVCDVHERD